MVASGPTYWLLVDARVIHGGDVDHVARRGALKHDIAAHRIHHAVQGGPVGLQIDLVVMHHAAHGAIQDAVIPSCA